MSKIRALLLATALVAVCTNAYASKPVEIEGLMPKIKCNPEFVQFSAQGSYTVLQLLTHPVKAHDADIAARVEADKARDAQTIGEHSELITYLQSPETKRLLDNDGELKRELLAEKYKGSDLMPLFVHRSPGTGYIRINDTVASLKQRITTRQEFRHASPEVTLPKKAAVGLAQAAYEPRLCTLKRLESYASLLRINAAEVTPAHLIHGTDSAYDLVETFFATKTRIAQRKARRLNSDLATQLTDAAMVAEHFCKFGYDCSAEAKEKHLVPDEAGRQAHALNMYMMYKYLRVLLEKEILPEVKDPEMPLIDLKFQATFNAKILADELKDFVTEREHKWRGRLTCDTTKLDVGLGDVIAPNLANVMAYHFALSQPAAM